MCLITKAIPNRKIIKIDHFIRVSKSDQIVYKFFNVEHNTLRTPYQNFKVSRTGDVMTVPKFGYRLRTLWYCDKILAQVFAGIHAYTSINMMDYSSSSCKVLECQIPAGTPYILSSDKQMIVTFQLIVPPLK